MEQSVEMFFTAEKTHSTTGRTKITVHEKTPSSTVYFLFLAPVNKV
jgi:hypothetical protein